MPKKSRKAGQITPSNSLVPKKSATASLAQWLEAYFRFEVSTLESSQREQRRDLELFLAFMQREVGSDDCAWWVPRLTHSFRVALQNTLNADGTRRWNDRTVNRILAHLKTFGRWVHQHQPFPAGDPVAKVRAVPTAGLLDVERALTPAERRKLLYTADLLLRTGGLSRDRHRHRDPERLPRHKSHRPYRNRAIIYTLIETGMRRAAVTKINVQGVDFDKRQILTEEKGGFEHTYQVSREGLAAIRDYLEHERPSDAQHTQSPALFLPGYNSRNTSGRFSPDAVSDIWNFVCQAAGVQGKSPHSARHAMGRHIIAKTGNVAAVQRQLGHKNAAYSLQYARITKEELNAALDDRE